MLKVGQKGNGNGNCDGTKPPVFKGPDYQYSYHSLAKKDKRNEMAIRSTTPYIGPNSRLPAPTFHTYSQLTDLAHSPVQNMNGHVRFQSLSLPFNRADQTKSAACLSLCTLLPPKAAWNHDNLWSRDSILKPSWMATRTRVL